MQTAVRIVVLDYYMSAPIPGLDVIYSEFRSASVCQVPTLRCFGSTENGKKICLHIHGVFPYLYIPYDGRGKPEELMYQMATAIDKAINVSFNQAKSNTQHVYKISLVSGIPMYGFHSKKHQFFKIYLYNPGLVRKVGEMLTSKTILNQIFQPHELHLNFTLQFMIDYNLHGMSNMIVSDIKFRIHPENKNHNIDESLFLPRNIERTSVCELEADINADSILNRQEILSGNLAVNPGIAALWEDEKQRRRNKNEESQLGNFLELKNMSAAPTKTHLVFQQALKERLAVLSTDKDIPKQNPDASIYPAETPIDSNIQNASLIDIHSASSLELSLDDTLNVSSSQAHNETITPSGENFDATMDEEAQDFLLLLEQLAEEKVAENEDVGILSQVLPDDQNYDTADDFLDLSMPLASLTTPVKTNLTVADHKSDEEDTDYFNVTLVPQIDGQVEYTASDEEPLSEYRDRLRSRKINPFSRKCGRSMPPLDLSNKTTTDISPRPQHTVNKTNLNASVKLETIEPLDVKKVINCRRNWNRKKRYPRKESVGKTLRLISGRVKKIDRQSRLQKIIKLIRFYEKYAMNSCKKTLWPKFNVVPGRKSFLDRNSNGTTISNLVALIHNYTDPNLHLLINAPSVAYFFYYGGYTYADAIEIPVDISSSEVHFLCDSYNFEDNKPKKSDIIRRRKLVSLSNKLLNIRQEEKRRLFTSTPEKKAFCDNKQLIVKIEDAQKIMKNLSNSIEEPVSQTHCLSEELEHKPKFKLLAEIEEANAILQNHLQFLKDFETNLSPVKPEPFSLNRSQFGHIKNSFYKKENFGNPVKIAPINHGYPSKDVTNLSNGNDLDSDDEVASILSRANKANIVEEKPVNLTPTKHFKRFASSPIDSRYISVPPGNKKNKRSPSISLDSDYASLLDNSSATHTSYDFIDGETSPLPGISSSKQYFNDSENQPTTSHQKQDSPIFNKDLSSNHICFEDVAESVINSIAKSNSCLIHQKIKEKKNPQINIISDIRIPSPLDMKFLRSRSRSIALENGRDQDTSEELAKESTLTLNQTNSLGKFIGKRRHTTSTMYLNCDGAADSSSEEDQKPHNKRKIVSRKLRSPRYAPLSITVTKSPRVQGLADNMVGFSGDHKDSVEKPSQLNRPIAATTDIPFKRKLVFGRGTPLNTTTTEELLACTYSPKSFPRTEKTINCSSFKDSNINQTETKTIEPHHIPTDESEPQNSQKYDSSSSESDLFPDNDNNLNRSFFKSYNLTVSEKYDTENKYRAKEGCSTVFSLNSITNSISQENKVISDNTSSDIPPYQEVSQHNVVLSNSSLKILLDNTSSDIPQSIEAATSNIIQPSFKAPSRSRVAESLKEYQIPRVQQQEPYYCNLDDYTGVVEIGHRVMRVASKTTAHLTEFDSDFNGLNKYRKHFLEHIANLNWNLNNLKTLKLTHCSNRTVIIHPLKKPPLAKQVKEWVKTNSKPYENEISSPKPRTERTKVYIPNSQGYDDSDLDLSLSLTPCALSQSLSSDAISSPRSQTSTSPVLNRRKKKTLVNRKPPKLRDSVLLSEETNKSCRITGISQNNSFGFDKSVRNFQAVRAFTEQQYLTTMVMELHTRTRGDLKPDPLFDSICAVFYSVLNDVPESDMKKSKTRGVIAVNSIPIERGAARPDFLDGIEIDCDITYVETEQDLVNNFISLINYWDPDIFAGYEIQMLSWGYLVERASVISINLHPLLGRSRVQIYGKQKLKHLMPDIESNIIGRIVLDVWRIMRHEIALQSYTFESIVYHILHRRVSMYPFKDLSFWWDHRSNLYRHRVVRYYLQRVDTVLELFDKLDFLNRTSELARLFGIMFYEVLSRGSQFRVESMMLRLAKPLNYIPVSPTDRQRSHMKAPEFIPLVMEPESKLYTDPVIVLDFQSLYPSIIIAYNYCFTTCVGRVNDLGTNHPFEFGATQLKVSKKIVEKLCKKELLNYSPCGVAFVKQKVREGILPRMLKEVLDTRLMVKNSMKENKGNDNLQKVLHNRQLGLKLIANVTYGYTAANFSGRMCCVEVGDSVVSKGRETLQRAIALVESTPEWEAKVVYGDTDSLFVLTSGKTKEEAFEIGRKIANAVTADNPDPIKLKLEKVYQPCILQTKKRYVGYMYESPDQLEPVYEAKGIETVRRDGCPAVAKMLQKCLTLLFETKNVSLIKNYVLKQFIKIQTGRASIQDLTFAKEYRGASEYKQGACVPALELARKWMAVDRRNEPRSGERVPYVIVNGPPGLPLIRLVRSPRDLLNDTSLRPNALYYITKVIIPPINRCLSLIGADLNTWFNQMPRKNTQYLPNSSPNVKSTISQYFISKICACCSGPTQEGLCAKCYQKANITALILTEKLKKWEENYNNTLLICQSCTGHLDDITCTSLDCPVLYRRTQTFNDLQQSTYVRDLLTTNNIFSEDTYFEL